MEREFEDLREIAMREIDEFNKKGELDENSLVCAYKLVDIVKDIHEIDEKIYEMNNGYSQGGMYPYMYAMDGNSYRGNNNSYGYGNSYANRNRDSMGRYSRNSYDNSYRGGYSREGERDEIMAKMEHMKNTAGSETERQMIQRIMNQVTQI